MNYKRDLKIIILLLMISFSGIAQEIRLFFRNNPRSITDEQGNQYPLQSKISGTVKLKKDKPTTILINF